MKHIIVDPRKVNEKRSKLEKAAEDLVYSIGFKPMQDKNPGAWVKKHGHNFPLDEFKAKHFDHVRTCKRLLKKN